MKHDILFPCALAAMLAGCAAGSAVPDGKPVVLLLHHQREADFHDPLRRFNIVASVSGHWHSSRLYDDGHMVHLNCPSSTMGGIDYSARKGTPVAQMRRSVRGEKPVPEQWSCQL